MTRQPRFELVHADDGWHARFRAANGRIVWTTEVHPDKRDATHAIDVIGRPMNAAVTKVGVRSICRHEHPPIEIREVDER